jgi:predicted GNAT family acetyltransferase
MATITSKVTIDEKARRFELAVDDDVAYIDYGWHKETLALLYVYVPIAHRGKGYSSTLIEYAMQYARDKNVKVMVYCSYINRYLRMHPEHHDLLSSE